MKGVVLNLLETVVRRDYGDDTWEALLDAADADGAYSSLGNYPDEEMMKLVGAASLALKMPADDVVRWFGRNALPLLAKKHPQFFRGS
jgi:Haem-NO-binding